MKPKTRKPNATRPRKTPYRPPKLITYGDLRCLTMGKMGGANDGGGRPNTKLPPAP